MVSSGSSTPGPSGASGPKATATGSRSTTGWAAGEPTAHAIASGGGCNRTPSSRARSTTPSGVSTPPASGPAGRRRGPGPGGKQVPDEPADHALGRSRGGFGTERHLVVESNGLPLSAVVTAGQAHESKSLEPVL